MCLFHTVTLAGAVGLLLPRFAVAQSTTAPLAQQRVHVTISGGHETDPRDGGRPVVLIAGALGVSPDVFRSAFSRVRPARGGAPAPSQVRENKRVLMEALAPYGIGNERLDEVSNYYRYRPGHEMWPITPAQIVAISEGGRIVRLEVVSGGSGYSSPPRLSVAGSGAVNAAVELQYGKDMKSNGSVKAVRLLP